MKRQRVKHATAQSEVKEKTKNGTMNNRQRTRYVTTQSEAKENKTGTMNRQRVKYATTQSEAKENNGAARH